MAISGRGRHRHVFQQRGHARAHFRRRFIGERDRQNGARRHVIGGDQVSNPVGDRLGFTAARAGQNQYRPIGCFDSFTLLGIEAREKVHYHFIFALGYAGILKFMAWTKLATLDELPPGSLIEVERGERLFALCNVEGDIRALDGRVPASGRAAGRRAC